MRLAVVGDLMPASVDTPDQDLVPVAVDVDMDDLQELVDVGGQRGTTHVICMGRGRCVLISVACREAALLSMRAHPIAWGLLGISPPVEEVVSPYVLYILGSSLPVDEGAPQEVIL